ncbi:NAD(P)/FAD-dependent oxidoreductase [Sphingorhabdus arenilitoris]|uniref:NAD(P)/FAD-dependent oxidoreductase n=1 Tax=Sphingorhabdus arenilitoris TaxID=1490041 RepID=A0ABV8RKD6_9SPHN
MQIAIIGAGMAGLSCGEKLAEAGHSVTLFDKGRGPGGRMSTRRMAGPAGDVHFDHGAQYFTVRDAGFAETVLRWQEEGVAAKWSEAGDDAFVGTPTMNAPIRHMAAQQNVHWSARVETIERRPDGWQLRGANIGDSRYDAVIVAVPAEQVSPLVAPWDAAMAAQAETVSSLPCWTVMAAFDERLEIDADTIREIGAIGWAARGGAKPQRSAEETWVIQATPAWSQSYLEADAAHIESALLSALSDVTGAALPEPAVSAAHRWRFARPSGEGAGAGMLWNGELGLGCCGDWLTRPRVESAWLSGQKLADAVVSAPVGAAAEIME